MKLMGLFSAINARNTEQAGLEPSYYEINK